MHSPLVGPATWEPVARELERRGHRAVVPSLLGATDAPACVAAAAAAVEEPAVLVGHSGAGILLPAIAAAARGPVTRLIFVDAHFPIDVGPTPLALPPFLESLRMRAVDGLLPPWTTWWGGETMRELVPDDDARAAVEREVRSLPLSYYEGTVDVPAGWDRVPCAFVLLSAAYEEPAAEARARGWPVREIANAEHLHLVVAPREVADALVELAS